MEPVSNAEKLEEIRERLETEFYVFIDRGQYGNDHLELREAQDDVEFLLSELDRLQSIQRERDKLIEGVTQFANKENWFEVWDSVIPSYAWGGKGNPQEVARTILKEIGVREERT